ncbi:hypothetical protein Slin15195_G059710 [Septoria linicola]|uniref:Uncharacterized protein n=1 Tax=Septoria linicola TaxID=215465 RepID=A0A9Q9EJX6_9PEZI|nr:hypothetical protein Slin14017_G075570 [Septoria linicola]USW52652.1 hypothetical protein Slin15195_G059710 [Septoria linicola]
MGLPGGITKDTSARKNMTPLAPHDAALQAYMQSFIQSIEQDFTAQWYSRQAEHGRDVEALRAYFNVHYNKARSELEKKYSADQEQLSSKGSAKVLELRTDFAQDALAATARHQSNASTGESNGVAERSDPDATADATATSANAGAALARASALSIKQEDTVDSNVHRLPKVASLATPTDLPPIQPEHVNCQENRPDIIESDKSKVWWTKYPATPMTSPQQLALGEKLVTLKRSHLLDAAAAKHSATLTTLGQELKEGQYVSLQDFAKTFCMSLNKAVENDDENLALTKAA